jgi:hypothetical protein
MTSLDEGVAILRGFVDRADREELGPAQHAILQYALQFGDASGVSSGLSALKAALAAAITHEQLHPLQGAFYTIVDAMIDRTMTEVSARAADPSR